MSGLSPLTLRSPAALARLSPSCRRLLQTRIRQMTQIPGWLRLAQDECTSQLAFVTTDDLSGPGAAPLSRCNVRGPLRATRMCIQARRCLACPVPCRATEPDTRDIAALGYTY